MSSVKCGLCNKSYPAIFSRDNTQGRGCSAEVTEDHLVGHYGSEVADMEVLAFNGAPPPNGTLVCDDCIRSGLASGKLKRLPHKAPGLSARADSSAIVQMFDRLQ